MTGSKENSICGGHWECYRC